MDEGSFSYSPFTIYYLPCYSVEREVTEIMSAFLKTAGRWGGVLTVIVLLITLLRQLISLVSFLFIAIKAMIVIAFIGLVLVMIFLVMRGRQERRREAEDI